VNGCDGSGSNDKFGWTGDWEVITAERPSGEDADLDDPIGLYGSVSEEEFSLIEVDSVFVDSESGFERECIELSGEILGVDQNIISIRVNSPDGSNVAAFFEVDVLREGEILEFQFTEAPDESQAEGVKVIAQSVAQSPTELANCDQ
jgi:hypothetical protein